MYGANDDQSIKVGKDWVKVGSEAWRQAYGERVEKVIKKLRAANLAMQIWGGLPIMRSPTHKRRTQSHERSVPRKGVHQRREICRYLERVHG